MAEVSKTVLEYLSEHESEIEVFRSDQDMKTLLKLNHAPGAWIELTEPLSEALSKSGFLFHDPNREKFRLTKEGIAFLNSLGLLEGVFSAVMALQKGQADEHEWKILWKHYCPKLDGVAHYLGLRDFERDDVAQNVFIRVFRKGKDLKEPEKFEHWFRRIAYNETKRFIRQQARILPLKSVHSPEEEEQVATEILDQIDLEKKILDQLQLEDVKDCIKKMPPRMRQVCLLFWDRELSQKEIAESMQITVKGVQRHLELARNFLRECVADKQTNTKKTE